MGGQFVTLKMNNLRSKQTWNFSSIVLNILTARMRLSSESSCAETDHSYCCKCPGRKAFGNLLSV